MSDFIVLKKHCINWEQDFHNPLCFAWNWIGRVNVYIVFFYAFCTKLRKGEDSFMFSVPLFWCFRVLPLR